MAISRNTGGGTEIGQVVTFAAIANIPKNYQQTAGAPLSMPSGAICFNGSMDPTISSTASYSVSCSDGLHTLNLTSGALTHYALNEGTYAFESRTASAALFPTGPLMYPMAGALKSGGLLVAGGASTSADCQVALKFNPSTGAWTQVANVPAGGWGGGDMHLLPDGRTLWIPSHYRNGGSTAVANTGTWLFYHEDTNAWETVTAASSIPTGVLFNLGAGSTGIGKGVKLPSGKIMLPSAGSSDMYIIDPIAHTFTNIARGVGPTSLVSSSCWLVPTSYGAAIIQAAKTSYTTYTEATGVWSSVNSFYACVMGSLSATTGYRSKGYPLLSGMFYLGNSTPAAAGNILKLDSYSPSGTVQAQRIS